MRARFFAVLGAVSILVGAAGCEIGDGAETSLRTDYAGVYAESVASVDGITSELRSGADDTLIATLRVVDGAVTWGSAAGDETSVELGAWELPVDELTANDTLYQVTRAMLMIEPSETIDGDDPYFDGCVGNLGSLLCVICTYGCSVTQCCLDYFNNSMECFSYNVCVQDGGTWS